jgi:chromosome segregation ATPase
VPPPPPPPPPPLGGTPSRSSVPRRPRPVCAPGAGSSGHRATAAGSPASRRSSVPISPRAADASGAAGALSPAAKSSIEKKLDKARAKLQDMEALVPNIDRLSNAIRSRERQKLALNGPANHWAQIIASTRRAMKAQRRGAIQSLRERGLSAEQIRVSPEHQALEALNNQLQTAEHNMQIIRDQLRGLNAEIAQNKTALQQAMAAQRAIPAQRAEVARLEAQLLPPP